MLEKTMASYYNHKYYFKGSGCMAGCMICPSCNKPIDSDSQDWLCYQKHSKYDWKYVTWHRSCCKDQSGWEKLENKFAKDEAEIEAIMVDIQKCREGRSPEHFAEALDRLFGNSEYDEDYY